MENISFKYFAKQYWWLLLGAALILTVGIGVYCGLFWQCIDESIIATIVMSTISYIGTVAWGLFIYYNSWSSEQLQKYRDKPRLRVSCVEKDDKWPLYTYEELVNNPLLPNDQYAKMFVFLKVKIANEGNHSIFNINFEDVLVQEGQDVGIPQGLKYFYGKNSSNVISFREQYESCVGVLKSVVGDNLETASNFITFSFSFQDDLLNIYYCEVKAWIHNGVQRIPCSSKIYTNSEYQKLKRKRRITNLHSLIKEVI